MYAVSSISYVFYLSLIRVFMAKRLDGYACACIRDATFTDDTCIHKKRTFQHVYTATRIGKSCDERVLGGQRSHWEWSGCDLFCLMTCRWWSLLSIPTN